MVSPVSESEVPQVQSFFERISTTIVAHAAQARELQGLRESMAELDRKLNALTIDSENLRRDLTQAWEYNANLERERNEAKRVAEEASADAMRARSETVQVRQEFERKLAMAQDTSNAIEGQNEELGRRLYNQGEEVVRWRDRSMHWERLAKDNAEKLALVQAALADVRSLFEPKEMPATVAEPAVGYWSEGKHYPEPVQTEQQTAINF